MALRVVKLATVFSETSISGFIAPGSRNRTIFFSRPASGNFTTQRRGDQEFQKWCNGGGMFHKSTCFDPTAQIEISRIRCRTKCLHWSRKYCKTFCYDWPLYNNWNLRARIGNHVQIGANTWVDRGSWQDTVIGDNTKIDNLVQIGQIGKNRMLCGQVGIAGSVAIGDYVTLGGRASIHDHVTIASKVRLAANSCITNNITESGDYGGFPAVPINEWRKHIAAVRKLSKQFQLNKNLKSPINTSNPRS